MGISCSELKHRDQRIRIVATTHFSTRLSLNTTNMGGGQPPIHSTGRGGAGNIGPDDREHIDANIVREGTAGQSDNSEFTTGGGGAGNVVSSPPPGLRSSALKM